MEKRIMFNEDCTFYLNARAGKEIIGKKQLCDYIDRYACTDITDFVINVNSGVSTYPSKSITSLIDKYKVRSELGKDVDYAAMPLVSAAYDLFERKNIDMFDVWIGRCRERGLRPWISIRMNDIHYTYDFELPNYAKTTFFYEHIGDCITIRHRGQIGYYDRTFDYGISLVREHFLSYIEETLDRYDVDGLELDFQREMLCFAPGEECRGREIMREFLRCVKEKVNSAQIRYGHEIKVSMRCMCMPQDNWELGFDVAGYAREKLVDLVIPTPRWGNSNYNIPVNLWKDLLRGTGTELAFGIENEVKSNAFSPFCDRDIYHTVETVKGCTSCLLSQGADSVYFFNYMDVAEWIIENQKSENWSAKHRKRKSVEEVLKDIFTFDGGDMRCERRHIAACEDFTPPWRKPVFAVPAVSGSPSEVVTVRIPTGKIGRGSEVLLKIGIAKGEPDGMNVFVNGKPAVYLGKEQCGFPRFTGGELHVFRIENGGDLGDAQIVEIFTKENAVEIDHMETDVNILY